MPLQSHALAFSGALITFIQNCFRDSDTSFVVFIDGESSSSQQLNFVADDVSSQFCGASGNRLFVEEPGAGCFFGGDCEGTCEVLSTEDSCLANPVVPTAEPTDAPTVPPENN